MPDPISLSYSLPFYLAALVFGYILGSTPFGLILTKMSGMGDVRNIGSGNIGATNVLRTGNKKIAALTLLGDMLKGTVAVLVAKEWGPDTANLAGMGAFLGHLFPIWLKFKGGKGVATYLGVLLGISPMGFALFAIIWLLTAYITRYSSLSALVASAITPVALFLIENWQLGELFAVLSALLWYKHMPNINRLLSGSEGKIGGGKEKAKSDASQPNSDDHQGGESTEE